MKKQTIIAIILWAVLSTTVQSQTMTITGSVKGTDKLPLELATVYVENPADSTNVGYAFTNKDGSFELEVETKLETLEFYASYVGLKNFHKKIKRTKTLNLGVIVLQPDNTALKEITIMAKIPPVKIKNDTIEYNANSFKTKESATLEDLLKKLPGVEVDREGNITVSGVDISQIKVNGKEFFSNDTKIALKNFPRDLIDKIQVVDELSDEDKFSGRKSTGERKMINIKTKSKFEGSRFTKVSAGFGTDKHYDANGSYISIRDKRQLNIVGGTNNLNNAGFSYGDAIDRLPRQSNILSPSSGITTSNNIALNAANEWPDRLSLNGNYTYGYTNTDNEISSNKEYILPDSSYYEKAYSKSNSINKTHNVSGHFSFNLNQKTLISFRPGVQFGSGRNNSIRNSETLNNDKEIRNQLLSTAQGEFNNNNFNSGLSVIRKLDKERSDLRYTMSYTLSRNASTDFLNANYYFSQTPDMSELQQQEINQDSQTETIYMQFSSNINVYPNLFLRPSYRFNGRTQSNERLVYDTSTGDNNLVFDLSNAFKSKSFTHTPSIGLVYESEKTNISSSFGTVFNSLKNKEVFLNNVIENNFKNIYGNFNVQFKPNQSKNMFFTYSNSTSTPSLNQLNPVVDNTDPLNIIVGNPDLNSSFSQNVSLRYTDSNLNKKSTFTCHTSFALTNDEVVSKTSIDEDFIRTTTYVNVDGNSSGSLYLGFFKSVDKRNFDFKYAINLAANYNTNGGFTNDRLYKRQNVSLQPSVNMDIDLENWLNLNPFYKLSFDISKYDLLPSQNRQSLYHNMGIRVLSQWDLKFNISTDFYYAYNNILGSDFQDSAFLWNAAATYTFAKNKASLNLIAYDLLNQNIDTQRVINNDFIEDRTSLVLDQYVMLSFSYKFDEIF